MTGAQAVVAMLRAHGIETVFGIPGVHTLPLYDALRDEPRLRHVLARHEQGAGFMAEGYARISGMVGVAWTITGPGLTNIATPMAEAYADSIPLLVISTALPRAATGRATGALHELKDQYGAMASLAGWSRAVTSAEELPYALRDAFGALRNERPRGAYLQIPLDLLAEPIADDLPAPAPLARPVPRAGDIALVADLLRRSGRPLIVAGAGVTAADAGAQLARLADLLGAPVLLGGKSRDVLPTESPLVLATSGYSLPPSLLDLVAASDATLVIGSKLGDQRTGGGRLAPPAPVVQIDLDPAEIGRRVAVVTGVVADARLALEALLERLAPDAGTRRSRLEEVARIRRQLREDARSESDGGTAYLDAVRDALPREAIVVADMTMLGYAAADYLPVYAPRTFIHPSELCTIGCGLPLALGAKVAAPDRPVVALCGDGGFLLTATELATAVQEGLGAIAVVFNDATYSAVKDAQRRGFGGRYVATDLRAPDYVALARAFGAHGVQAVGPMALHDALVDAQRRVGPTVIEVPLPPRDR